MTKFKPNIIMCSSVTQGIFVSNFVTSQQYL